MTAASLTIDLSAIVANWQALDRMTQVETGAVVKADAYGLGVAPVGRALARAGVRQFFVAQAQEGAELRHALGDGVEIFVFSGHMRGDTDTLVDLNLIPMLNSLDQMIRHFEGAPGAAFGIQLDTGMNRLGMEPQEWEAVREVALAQSPRLIISHLACADEPNNPMNAAQLSLFRAMTDGVGVPCSLAATGGLLLGSDYHFDMTRPGIGLYGGLPFAEAKPVIQLDLPAIQTRVVRPGETVGYACSWEAASPTSVTTVSAGYADGLPRSLGEGCTLWHEGTPCPVVGRISMDLITVDTSALREPPTQLSILCEDQSFDALADAAGTIGYEILTALGRRYTRRYRD